jgi:methyltransferase (TIGR00027 family)
MVNSESRFEGTIPMHDDKVAAPESTAVRVALWRAMHVQLDSRPHILEDDIGLRLVDPDPGWRQRPDMDPHATSLFRASIVARARFIEDLVEENARQGVHQYVILGAGLDTFAQRKPQIASTLRVFEVDQPGPQEWKRQRLIELGFTLPDWLHFVPVDFEAHSSWLQSLESAGFQKQQPAVVASTGVSLYLSKAAIAATLRQIAGLAPGSTLAMTYLLPLELATPEERPAREAAEKGARASGTPFITFYRPEEMIALAREAGFRDARRVSAQDLAKLYFTGRTDDFRLGNSEELLVAKT